MFIAVAILATSVILPKLNDAVTLAPPLASVIVKVPKPVIFATLLLTNKLELEPLYSFTVMYEVLNASTFVNAWLVSFVVIFAVSIVKPVPATYPVPAFVIAIELISPLLCKLGTTVATLLPVVGLFIVMVGK